MASIPIIGKISFGGALTITAPEDRQGYKGRLFWARSGDLVYSKIRVKQGSLCIVPSDIERIAVSSEYPVYAVNSDLAIGSYLTLVLRSSQFARLLDGLSHGGSTKTRISPGQFEKVRVPLPAPEVQRAIVARWRAAQEAVAAANERIARIERDTQARFLTDLGLALPERATPPKAFALRWGHLQRWGVQLAWQEHAMSPTSRYEMKPLGLICQTGSGGTPSRQRKGFFGGGIPWVKTSEVRNNIITQTEETLSEEGLANSAAKIHPEGSIIVAMYGQGATRGRTAKLGVPAATNQACLVLTEFVERVLPDFVWAYLMNRYDDIRALASGNNQPNLSAELIRSFPVPLPPPSVQQAMVERVEAGRDEIAREREAAERLRRETQAEVEAMILGHRPATALD